jgi:hypothetical protein
MEHNQQIFADMVADKPYKSYIKGILGRVHVSILDPLDGDRPSAVMLFGDPNSHDENCIVKVWSEMEDLYFRRMNKKFLSDGTILLYSKPEEVAHERTFEESTDEELSDFLKQKYFNIQNKLSTVTSEAILFRLLSLARSQEKPEKLIKLLELKLSELQLGNLGDFPQKLEVER